jgi:hypothetical protein
MRVLCVKWGVRYGAEWVLRLRNMVARHLPIPHQFVCVTDAPVDGVDCVPFISGLHGWWSKIELFYPGRFGGDNLYLDLDVVLTGSLEKLVRCLDGDRSRLWALDDFSYSLVNPRQGIGGELRRLLGGDGTINSSVMLWHSDAAKRVWTRFKPEVMDVLHGDQNWITQALWPDKINLIPPGIANSYKYHVMRGESPAPVCVFHGQPKASDLPRGHQLRQTWETA